MKKIWFTSDHHFGHKNIIKYSNRPFSNIDEMNNELIKRWNEKVGKNDIVYYMGDFAFMSPEKIRQLVKQLNGKICLIIGNHESSALKCPDCFVWIKHYYELIVFDYETQKKQYIYLFHYAMKVWNKSHYGSWHLYGHSHGNLPDDKNSLSFDVGVDCHNYYPLSYQEVKEIMSKKEHIKFKSRN